MVVVLEKVDVGVSVIWVTVVELVVDIVLVVELVDVVMVVVLEWVEVPPAGVCVVEVVELTVVKNEVLERTDVE
jgi:hypothetical protein